MNYKSCHFKSNVLKPVGIKHLISVGGCGPAYHENKPCERLKWQLYFHPRKHELRVLGPVRPWAY